jgi:hypothetical protein
MTVKEWREDLQKFVLSCRLLAQPVDFAGLQKKGIITKAGARYIVHNLRDLPAHAREKIYEFAPHEKGVIVKFRKPSKRAEKLAERFEKQMKELDAQHLNPDDEARLGFK